MPDLEAGLLGDVFYEPSAHLAVYSGQDVVWTLPVLVRRSTNISTEGTDASGEFFVLVDGQYHEARSLSGFTRFESQPKARPRPKPVPLPIFPREHREPKANIYDRLAEAQERWAQEKK
jgi:hypothetical protein